MKVSGHNTRSNLLRYNSVTECERADALVILLNAGQNVLGRDEDVTVRIDAPGCLAALASSSPAARPR